MAPRGGGGGHGGGGGGGHSSGSSSSSSSGGSGSSGSRPKGSSGASYQTNWSQNLVLSGGGHFQNVLETIALALVCFALVAMLFIAAWSFTIKDHKRLSMRFFGLPLALFAQIGFFSIGVADRFLKEFNTNVRNSYILLYVGEEFLRLLAHVVTLAIVWTIVRNRQTALWKEAAATTKYKIWGYLKTVTLLILTGLWLADSAIYLMYSLAYLNSSVGNVSFSALRYISQYGNVHAAFCILYLIASIDVMIASVLIARGASKNKHLRTSASKIPTFLIFIIMPALVLRSLVDAVYAVNYSLLHHNIPPAANLVGVIFYAFPTIAIFIGIVLVGKQSDWSAEYSAVSQGREHGAYASNTAYGGAAKGDPNEERQSWMSTVPAPPQYSQPQPSPGLYNPPTPPTQYTAPTTGAYIPPPPPPPPPVGGASADYYNGYHGRGLASSPLPPAGTTGYHGRG